MKTSSQDEVNQLAGEMYPLKSSQKAINPFLKVLKPSTY